MGRRVKKAQAVIVQFFVHAITLSSEIQKSWGVQRVCVSYKFADNADAAAALKGCIEDHQPKSTREWQSQVLGAAGGGEEGSRQTCIRHSCA